MRLLPILLSASICLSCGSITDSNKEGSTDFSINVSVTGSKTHVDRVQVCVKSQGSEIGCGPIGNPGGIGVGASAVIAVKADPGWNYEVEVPSNQQAASFCSVTSGGAGVFGTSMPPAMVTCN